MLHGVSLEGLCPGTRGCRHVTAILLLVGTRGCLPAEWVGPQTLLGKREHQDIPVFMLGE